MSKFSSIILIFCLIFYLGCAGNSDNSQVTLVNLKLKSCFDKLESKKAICLDSVYQDSRCAEDVVCVWEGDVLAAFTLKESDKHIKFVLHVNEKFRTDTIINGLSIKLINILPRPIANQAIDLKSYSAEIKVNE